MDASICSFPISIPPYATTHTPNLFFLSLNSWWIVTNMKVKALTNSLHLDCRMDPNVEESTSPGVGTRSGCGSPRAPGGAIAFNGCVPYPMEEEEEGTSWNFWPNPMPLLPAHDIILLPYHVSGIVLFSLSCIHCSILYSEKEKRTKVFTFGHRVLSDHRLNRLRGSGARAVHSITHVVRYLSLWRGATW